MKKNNNVMLSRSKYEEDKTHPTAEAVPLLLEGNDKDYYGR